MSPEQGTEWRRSELEDGTKKYAFLRMWGRVGYCLIWNGISAEAIRNVWRAYADFNRSKRSPIWIGTLTERFSQQLGPAVDDLCPIPLKPNCQDFDVRSLVPLGRRYESGMGENLRNRLSSVSHVML